MSVHTEEALSNHLLASLPEEDFKRIKPKLESVPLKLGEVLYESGDRLSFAFFPTNVIISMLYEMQNGQTAEIGIVGNDGVLGNAMILGGETTTSRAVVQNAGVACKMTAADMKAEFDRGGAFQRVMLRYTQALMTQISQTAVCNRLHNINQQFARWILISHDRLADDRIVMTHDLISNMLGVRREGVTLAAQKLAAKGLIKNERGTIVVIDRQGIEQLVCECYRVVNDEYNRLLGRGVGRSFA